MWLLTPPRSSFLGQTPDCSLQRSCRQRLWRSTCGCLPIPRPTAPQVESWMCTESPCCTRIGKSSALRREIRHRWTSGRSSRRARWCVSSRTMCHWLASIRYSFRRLSGRQSPLRSTAANPQPRTRRYSFPRRSRAGFHRRSTRRPRCSRCVSPLVDDLQHLDRLVSHDDFIVNAFDVRGDFDLHAGQREFDLESKTRMIPVDKAI